MLKLKKNSLIGKAFLLAVLSFSGSASVFAGEVGILNQTWITDLSFLSMPGIFVEDLAVGASKSVTIRANEPYNFTHIYLRKDKKYRFTVASPAWNNALTETDAAGYNDPLPYANTRRHTDYKTMALIGEIFTQDNNKLAYSGTHFLIGLGRSSYKASRSGYLVAFANDCLACYGDNSRVVTLTVKRLD